MNQPKKLQSIIEYAIKNGYTCEQYQEYGQEWVEDSGYVDDGRLEHLVFSHSFLKAFFGEKIIRIGNEDYLDTEDFYEISWKYYAKNLVLISEEQRIDYLYNFIKADK